MTSTMRVGFLLMSLVLCSYARAAHAEVAVVVNKENPADNLSLRELVKIFKQEKQHWGTGKPVYLLLREAGSSEMATMLRVVYGMREDHELKTYWLGMMFREEIASFPQVLSSNEAVKRFVSQAPNAIGVIDAASVDDRVKVLQVEGKLPGEPGYLLVRMTEKPEQGWAALPSPAPPATSSVRLTGGR